MGPQARALLSRLSAADLSEDGFSFGASRLDRPRLLDRPGHPDHLRRRTRLGTVCARPSSPSACTRTCWPRAPTSAWLDAGYYAIESLRLEKAYRAFGRELTPDYNPVEAGLTFACKLGGSIGFLGREAVEKARADGPRRRLVSVVLGDPEVMMWGGELLLRDGEPAAS